MRAIALHEDVLVATSEVFALNCVLVRAGARDGESFVIDSPLLPGELEALPALMEQARFPSPSGLLATHGDWDHLLGRAAFPELALGCAQSTAERLQGSPGEAQRELRTFDEDMLIERQRPLALGSVQALPVPGRCSLGEQELELHPTGGHTGDGMAILIPWAKVIAAGDYLSAAELPLLGPGGSVDVYRETLARLDGLLAGVEHVVPGHGPVLDSARALQILAEDLAYLDGLEQDGAGAQLPQSRRRPVHRRQHERNVAKLAG